MIQFQRFMENGLNITSPEIDMPIIGFLSPWGDNIDYGASLEYWKIDYNVDNVMNDIFKPNENENIYIAVSSYSWNSGFVEGGLVSSVQNLMLNFDMDDVLENESICPLP